MKKVDSFRTVEVEMQECILCGVCEELAPHVFTLNDAGYVEVDESQCRHPNVLDQAAANCPKDCIILNTTAKDGSGK